MLQLQANLTINVTTQTELTRRQSRVGTNSLVGTTLQTDFEEQKERAESQWKGLSTRARADIIAVLRNAYQGAVGICQYCENNEGTDIEHIYPKTHFPHRCFIWENYVLACSNCNTRYKKDKFSVFVPIGSVNEREIPVRRGRNAAAPVMPWTEDGLIIDSRTENPMDYLVLDILQNSFHFSPHPSLNARDRNKALFTKDLVGLNRGDLAQARRNIFQNFTLLLEQYIRVSEATNIAQIAAVAAPFNIDNSQQFSNYQQQVLGNIKRIVLTSKHLTVWFEILRQREYLSAEIQQLIQQSGAATW